MDHKNQDIELDLHSYDYGDGRQVIYDSEDREIAQVGYFGGGSEADTRALDEQDTSRNVAYAKLFTSAPSLLVCLREMTEAFQGLRDSLYDGPIFEHSDDEKDAARMDELLERASSAILQAEPVAAADCTDHRYL